MRKKAKQTEAAIFDLSGPLAIGATEPGRERNRGIAHEASSWCDLVQIGGQVGGMVVCGVRTAA